MKSMIMLTIVAGIATPAIAGATPQPSSAQDPERVICRVEPVVGTRLSKVRRCMRASEWAEIKRLTRETTEKVQVVADERPN